MLLLCCAQLCPTLFNPMDCSPASSSVHGISQARILEWAAISCSRGSFQPRNQTQVSCITGRFQLSLLLLLLLSRFSRVRLCATP